MVCLMRKRKNERKKEREKERERERKKEREKERDSETLNDRQRNIKTVRQTDRDG